MKLKKVKEDKVEPGEPRSERRKRKCYSAKSEYRVKEN